MDKIEQYYRDHSPELDVLEPDPASWDHIRRELDGEHGPGNDPEPKPHSANRKSLYLLVAATIALIMTFTFWPRPDTGAIAGENPQALQVGDPFPELVLDNQFGEAVSLSSLQGKVVLIEFWASYSKVCTERQCYYFKPIYDQYAEHGFEIYGISVDTNTMAWMNHLEEDGLPWINVQGYYEDSADLEERFLVQELPTTFLLDQSGRIVAKDVGEDDLEDHLERLLAGDR